MDQQEKNEHVSCTIISDPGVKSVERSKEKVSKEFNNDWRKITDITRSSIAFSSLENLDAGRLKAAELFKEAGLEIVFEKNKFTQPAPSGYRDINILIKDKEIGYIGEVQLHVCHIFRVKNPEHEIYEEIRAIIEGKTESDLTESEKVRVAALREKSREIYEQAYKSAELEEICLLCLLLENSERKNTQKRSKITFGVDGKIRANNTCEL